jgi:hypothetical protein
MPPLLVLAPIEPCASGNGLAMRVASFVCGAASTYDVRVAVVRVVGALPSCPAPVSAPVIVVPFPGRAEVRTNFAQLLNDPAWRQLLANADPMPLPATLASLALAPFISGSGTRIKLLEAFAHQVPVVTTPIGAAGRTPPVTRAVHPQHSGHLVNRFGWSSALDSPRRQPPDQLLLEGQ